MAPLSGQSWFGDYESEGQASKAERVNTVSGVSCGGEGGNSYWQSRVSETGCVVPCSAGV